MSDRLANGVETNGIHAMAARKNPRELPLSSPRLQAPVLPPKPLNALTLLRSLRTNWRKACFWGVVTGAVMAFLVWNFLPPLRPMAYTKLRLIPPDQSNTSIRAPESQIEQKTHKELILSQLVLGKVLDVPGIAELPTIRNKGSREQAIKSLKNEVQVDFPSGPEIIRIRMEGDRPDDIGTIVSAVEHCYINEVTGRAQASREARYLDIKTQRIEAEKRLKKIREALTTKFEASPNSSGSIEAQQMQLQTEYYSVIGELQRLEREENQTAANLELLKNKLASREKVAITEAVLAAAMTTDDEAIELGRKTRELAKQYEEYKLRYEPGAPALTKLETEKELLQKKLDERKKKARKTLEDQAQEKFLNDTREAIATKEGEEKVLKAQIAALQLRRDTLKKNVGGRVFLDGKDIDLEQAQEEFSKLRSTETQAELEMRAKQGIEELEPATIEIPNDSARRTKISLLAAIAGFASMLILFAFVEFRARRIDGIDEVVMDMGLRLIGSIPRCPSKSLDKVLTNPSPSELRWNISLTESIDSARTLFLHAARAADIKTVLISSAVAGEGKSTVARNLAASLARSGRQTLLIDGDLRKPTQHGFFGLPVMPGVCEVLRGEVQAADAIRSGKTPNLFVLPAGRVERLSIQQLAQEGMGRLLADVRDRFEFIVVDSSPILAVADGLLMARQTDCVLLSLFAHVSRVESVQATILRLTQMDVPVIGAIVNGTREESNSYGNNNYHSTAVN